MTKDLSDLEDFLFILRDLKGGVELVDGPFPPEPKGGGLTYPANGSSLKRHFIVWYPDSSEPDGLKWTRVASLQTIIELHRKHHKKVL